LIKILGEESFNDEGNCRIVHQDVEAAVHVNGVRNHPLRCLGQREVRRKMRDALHLAIRLASRYANDLCAFRGQGNRSRSTNARTGSRYDSDLSIKMKIHEE
jgi:hypothetical protein